MGVRRDITADLDFPETVLDHTAVVMLKVLEAHQGQEVPVHVMNKALDKHKFASRDRKCDAVKALRNMGHVVDTKKARHLSTYRLGGQVGDVEKYTKRVLREAYSQQITVCRTVGGLVTLTSAQDPQVVAVHEHSKMSAISMGMALGLTIDQVLKDVVPL